MHACKSFEVRKEAEPGLYQMFVETHDCSVNHEGSSGSMESSGLWNVL